MSFKKSLIQGIVISGILGAWLTYGIHLSTLFHTTELITTTAVVFGALLIAKIVTFGIDKPSD